MGDDEREDVAEALRRARAEARRAPRLPDPAFEASDGPPEPSPVVARPRTGEEQEPSPEPLRDPPDAAAVNAAWRAEAAPPSGPARFAYRLLDRILRPRFEAQQKFNARQVQLDNETLSYLDERFAAVHRHYDRLLGLLGRRLDEADERHAILEKELVAHVHDLVRRIDLVLADSNRDRLGLEFALEELRLRLEKLEQALGRRP